jgi:hypothetical protein
MKKAMDDLLEEINLVRKPELILKKECMFILAMARIFGVNLEG